MSYGYHGRILRVNLSSGATSVDEHDDTWYRRYVGGATMSAHYLLKEVPAGADPLGPDNLLVMAPGVATGLPLSGFSRLCVAAKSPLTGGIGKSEAGAYFPAELKHAGYDGIVFQGESERPAYLWIKDGAAELRDAGHLWGRGVGETTETLKAEVGERFARVAAIGSAGERGVRFATVMNDGWGAAGRGGMGAVMGSKKLKAVVVRGKTPPAYADPETIKALGKAMAQAAPTKARQFHEYGTGGNMTGFNDAGNLPTRNFQDGWFDNVNPTTAQTIKETIRIGMEACYACAVRCKKVVKVDEPWVADPRYGGPEYETLASFGANCGIDNLAAIARAHHLCNHHGMDTISAGATVAFAMECFEKGYLTAADCDGLELTWGNAEAMLALLEMVAERRGIGDLLADGSRRAARRIGKGAEALAMHTKGLELGMHEPRLKQGMGLGYATAAIGGDHCNSMHDLLFEKAGPAVDDQAKPLGVLEPMPASDLSTRKVHFFAQTHRWKTAQDSLVACIFVPWSYDETVRLVNAATGWNTSLAELLLVGERGIVMGRLFNLREGFTPADDTLPARFFSPPLKGKLAEKAQAVDPAALRRAVRSYYSMMGWDLETGSPTRETLERLEIAWAGDRG